MAGKFVYFTEDEGHIIGHTHGCSCCSNSVTVGVTDIEDHIRSLETALKEAKAHRRRLVAKDKKLQSSANHD